jgi:hypothetical protein
MRGDVRQRGADEPGEGSAPALGGGAEGGRVSAGNAETDWIEGELEWSWPVWGEPVAVGGA